MNNELLRTGLFAAAAIALAGAAAYIEPEASRAEIFSDAGEIFFPNFRDVMAVKAIEVVDYDEAEATARPLKVEFRKNRWTITSHSDYPAEARDRLAKTASALLDLKKDSPVSDRFEDQAAYGVIDPLDARNPSLSGRGKRVTLRDAGGAVLAELVLGNAVKDKAGYRYVRLPGQKRTYMVKTDADPSAHFADWVEANLLRLTSTDVARMTLNSYQIDEQFGRVANLQRTIMVRDKENWNEQAKSMASTLASLRVAGARPKPPELAQQLRTKQLALTLDTVMSLRQRGYFITPAGALLSNEGELIVESTKGVNYTLRFGEVVSDATASAAAKPREDRYLFVMVAAKSPEGGPLAESLNNKFADWYYVISGTDFARLHPTRAAQLKALKERPPQPGPPTALPPAPSSQPPPPPKQ